jgi:hypothetical protein
MHIPTPHLTQEERDAVILIQRAHMERREREFYAIRGEKRGGDRKSAEARKK